MEHFKIYQIRLDKLERQIVNQKGHESLTKQIRKLDMEFADNAKIEKLAKESWNAGDYDYVAIITAGTLQDVFEVGNMDIPREKNPHINDIDKMYSVSVGNIIEADGSKWVVGSYGFVQI
jgi:hypothetical protein